MLETYELYFPQPDGPPRFEPLTTRPTELISAAKRRLTEVGAASVDVHHFGRLLFSLAGDAPPET